MAASCDLQGLAYIFEDLFDFRTDVPRDVLKLMELCVDSDHDKRPDLETVRQCLIKEIAEAERCKCLFCYVTSTIQPMIEAGRKLFFTQSPVEVQKTTVSAAR